MIAAQIMLAAYLESACPQQAIPRPLDDGTRLAPESGGHD
jgi:hypothetical protein